MALITSGCVPFRETAHFAIKSDKAYGPPGSPPVIPPSATLQFEIELVSFTELDDIRGTGGAVQVKWVEEGEGYEKPKEKDMVLLKLKLSLESGAIGHFLFTCCRMHLQGARRTACVVYGPFCAKHGQVSLRTACFACGPFCAKHETVLPTACVVYGPFCAKHGRVSLVVGRGRHALLWVLERL